MHFGCKSDKSKQGNQTSRYYRFILLFLAQTSAVLIKYQLMENKKRSKLSQDAVWGIMSLSPTKGSGFKAPKPRSVSKFHSQAFALGLGSSASDLESVS